ncbi:SDR family oxidoreductase [Amycolatopsis sp. RM579]|uniref:SDR family oxidoreductase n=1 Tax=Amycolatopsis pithecellobii TaxID=664692 RepID=A0A6N7Z108_9PSEU|nr:SDR family oxidoreductase [Amycolatopsis pithecellobii]
MSYNRLAGRVAIITGGGNGIGRAYATRMAAEGAHVVIAELDKNAGEAAAEEIRNSGRSAIAVHTDVADEASTLALAEACRAQFGRIDILVNNAAIFASVQMSRTYFDEIPIPEWDSMMAVNLRGTWLCCRAVVPVMKERGYGKIINISSGTAFRGPATRIHYVTTKAGILGYTKVLAREVGQFGICVNCIAPGNTASEEEPDPLTLELRTGAVSNRALKRVEVPEDLTGAAVFFASADSDFITGQTLVVDGGATMH